MLYNTFSPPSSLCGHSSLFPGTKPLIQPRNMPLSSLVLSLQAEAVCQQEGCWHCHPTAGQRGLQGQKPHEKLFPMTAPSKERLRHFFLTLLVYNCKTASPSTPVLKYFWPDEVIPTHRGGKAPAQRDCGTSLHTRKIGLKPPLKLWKLPTFPFLFL